jgi:hypothetical protein
MKNRLNANVQGTAAINGFVAGGAFSAALGAVAVTTALAATVGFLRGINGSLRHRGAGLSLNSGNGFGHNILRCGGGQNRCGQRRNLHKLPQALSILLNHILPERNEQSFKHLVSNITVEKSTKNKLLGRSAVCGSLQQ